MKNELLNVPSMEQISKEWRIALASSPKIVRKCPEIDTYGSIIFKRTRLENIPLEFGLFSIDKHSAKDIVIPELANIIPGKYFILFSMQSPEWNVDSLIYLVFDNKNEHIEHIFCYDLRKGISRKVKTDQELEDCLDIIMSGAHSN